MSAQAKFTTLMREHFGDTPIIGIEIGTASGIWTEYVLRNYPNIEKLYTIDPYKHFEGENYEGGRPQDWHDYIKSVADKRLTKEKYPNLVRLIQTSEEARREIPEKVDFVYIDGNHNEPYVRFDVDHYYPFVREGGIFGGHDYNISHVKRIVDKKFGEKLNYIMEDARIWYVYK